MTNETKWTAGPYSEPSRYGNVGFEIQAQGRSIAVVNRVDEKRRQHLDARRDAKAKRNEPGHDEEREAKEIEARADEALATAYLFRAAPDMYRALVEAAETIEWLAPAKEDCKCSGDFRCVAHDGLEIVRAALAKARGTP
jgi:hypothetical protein